MSPWTRADRPPVVAKRTVAVLAASLALVSLASGCSSSDKKAAPPTTKVVLTMSTTPPEATRLGVCTSFTTKQMQDLLGSAKVGSSLPAAISESGGAVSGESCSWQRTGKDGAARSVRIEARDYGADQAGLTSRFDELKSATQGATDMPGVQDAAFSAQSDETSVVQIRLRHYLLTATSRGTGGLDPLTPGQLGIVLGSTLTKLP